MSDAVFWAICVPLFVCGFAAGRWRFAPAVPFVLWIAAVGVAALAGAFRPSDEDNTLGLVFFFVADTAVWVACLVLGVVARRVVASYSPGASGDSGPAAPSGQTPKPAR